MIRVIYISAEGFSSTVFESQVRDYTNRLRSDDVLADLIVLQPYQWLFRPKSFLKFFRERIFGRDTAFLSASFAHIPDTVKNAQGIAQKLSHLYTLQSTLIHCRGPVAAIYGLELAKRMQTKTPVLLDVRGDYLAEYQESDPSRAQYLKGLEKTAMEGAGGYSFVSLQLRDKYQEQYLFGQKPLGINIAAYNELNFYYDLDRRRTLRARMNWQAKIIFVYCGGTQAYQGLDMTLKAFKELSNFSEQAHLMLILARPAGWLRGRLAELDIDSSRVTTIVNMPHCDVPHYLNAADWGLVFREPNAINEVATPTKIAEYFGCGLHVLYGGGAGYYGALIRDNPRLGTVVPFSEDLSTLALPKVGESERQWICNFAVKTLSMSVIVESYKQLYRQMLE